MDDERGEGLSAHPYMVCTYIRNVPGLVLFSVQLPDQEQLYVQLLVKAPQDWLKLQQVIMVTTDIAVMAIHLKNIVLWDTGEGGRRGSKGRVCGVYGARCLVSTFSPSTLTSPSHGGVMLTASSPDPCCHSSASSPDLPHAALEACTHTWPRMKV